MKRNRVPYLLVLAMASNAGSTATITGNPQNMMIGSLSRIAYQDFAGTLVPVAAAALIVFVVVVALAWRHEFLSPAQFQASAPPVAINRALLAMADRARSGAGGAGSDRLSRQSCRPVASPRIGTRRRAALWRARASVRRGEIWPTDPRHLSPGRRPHQRTLHGDRKEPRIHVGSLAAGAATQSRQAGIWRRPRREYFLGARSAEERAVNLLGCRTNDRSSIYITRKNDRIGLWICVGPLSDGWAKNRTFVWWLDLAERGWPTFRLSRDRSGHSSPW